MPRRPLTFRQRDLAAAIRTAKAAGISVARYEIAKDGTITIVPGEPAKPAEEATSNPERDAIFEALRK